MFYAAFNLVLIQRARAIDNRCAFLIQVRLCIDGDAQNAQTQFELKKKLINEKKRVK